MKKHYFTGLKKAVPTLYRSHFPRIVLLFYSFFFLLLCQAQEYRPLAVDGAQWIVRKEIIGWPQPVHGLWEYSCKGDTVVNGFSYAKIYKRSLVVTQDPPPFEANSEYGLIGFIRDDVSAQKVYAITFNSIGSCPYNEEFLMYDYGLVTGDTVNFCLAFNYLDETIASVTEEQYFGFYTRGFHTGIGYDYDYYEGIGSLFGLFETMFVPVKAKSNTELERTWLYYYCREAPCNLVVSVPDLHINNAFTISPNPAHDNIRLTLTSEKTFQKAIIYNAQGIEQTKLILQPGIYDYDIDVRHLPAGFYFVGLMGDAYQVTKTKLVIGNY
jgi:hypothetical protein